MAEMHRLPERSPRHGTRHQHRNDDRPRQLGRLTPSLSHPTPSHTAERFSQAPFLLFLTQEPLSNEVFGLVSPCISSVYFLVLNKRVHSLALGSPTPVPFAATRMDLEDIIPSQVCQAEKDKWYVMPHTWNLKNNTSDSIYKTEADS